MTWAGGGEIPRVTSVGRYCEPDCDGTTLTSKSITVQVTSKGQVTIPREIRNRLGLLPNTEVEFELAGDHPRIRKAPRPPRLSACRGVLVDSNVLLDVISNDPVWSAWSASALAEAAEYATLVINPIIYAEVSTTYSTN